MKPSSELRPILLAEIDAFLENDNHYRPELSRLNRVTLFFKGETRENRQKAESYKAKISKMDESQLFFAVWRDCCVNQGSDPKLQIRLLQGLCQYMKCSQADIQLDVQNQRLAAAFSSGGSWLTTEDALIISMRTLIRRSLQALPLLKPV